MHKDKVFAFIYYFLLLVMIGSLIHAFMPYPPDDFLRHIRYLDYKELGGYSYMYPYSQFQNFSFTPWFGFDLIAGTLKDLIGSENTILIYQIVCACLFFIAIIMNTRSSNPEEEKEMVGVYILFGMLIMSYCLYRTTLIRPCIILSILTLISLRGKGFILGFSMAAFSGFLYYLFFLYTFPLAIVHYFKGNKRFGIGVAVATVIAIISWIYITELEYFKVLGLIVSGLLTSREGIVISENVFSLSKITNPLIFITFILFVATLVRHFKLDIYLAFIILTIPMAYQVRYFLDITFPLMFIYIVRNNLGIQDFIGANRKVFEVAALVSLLLLVPPLTSRSLDGNIIRLDGINLPKGSVVFSENMEAGFSLVYWNKEPVRFMPAAEVGWSDVETKKMVKKIGEDKEVNQDFCSYAEKYGITHILTTHPVKGDCFRHIETSNKGVRIDLFERRENGNKEEVVDSACSGVSAGYVRF